VAEAEAKAFALPAQSAYAKFKQEFEKGWL
jgi:hypothetical protein